MAADSDVEKIKDRLNIVEVVGQYVTLRRAGRTYTARCPFHKEKTPSFHVSPERGTYKCFGCGEGGDIFSFVQKVEGVDFPTALRELAKQAGIELTHQPTATPQHKEHDERLREVLEAAAAFYEHKLKERPEVADYLRSRGVAPETVAQWRLGYAPADWRQVSEHAQSLGFSKQEIVDAGLAARSDKKPDEIYDRFRGRIMFPIMDAGGRVVAFSGRFFEKVPGSKEEGEPAKYVNSPETALFKKSRTLYGWDKAKTAIRKADCILLVEGQFDLILAHQSGLHFAVALSGTALTPEHLSLLGRLSKRLVLALDADAAGVRAGLRSAQMALKAGFDVKIPTFPPGKDPADLAKENPELLKAAVRTSQPAVEFFLAALRAGAKDERAYIKTVEAEVLPLIAAIGSSIDQEHFVRITASRLGVPEAAVRREVAKRPVAPSADEPASDIKRPDEGLDALQKKSGMLLYHFGKDSAVVQKLEALLGAERLAQFEIELEPHAEMLRFKFDEELAHTDEETIAKDMLSDLERLLMRERFLAAGGDTKKLQELADRHRQMGR